MASTHVKGITRQRQLKGLQSLAFTSILGLTVHAALQLQIFFHRLDEQLNQLVVRIRKELQRSCGVRLTLNLKAHSPWTHSHGVLWSAHGLPGALCMA